MKRRSWLYAGLAVAGIPAAGLLLLPASAKVSRSVIVAVPPQAVFALVRSQRGFDRFSPFKVDDAGLETEFAGPDAGPGATVSWRGKAGDSTQTIVREIPNRAVVMQLELGAMGQPVQTFSLTPVNGGTRVTWTLDADFGLNPVARVFGLRLDPMLGPTYETGLARLKQIVEA